MKHLISFVLTFLMISAVKSQTTIPNGSFEDWVNYSNYSDPQYWDTPNEELMAIPFFGTTVVTRSNDHQAGTYSAKLETKHITLPPVDVPGVLTLGELTIDIFTQTYTINGGAPINDIPTHLKGFFKFQPQGGDSCVIGIGLTRMNGGVRDSIGAGYYSTHDTVNAWTPFSAWIDYDTVAVPDTFNILVMSSAVEVPTPGTILYVDDLFLDYTVGRDEDDPSTGIRVYQDKEVGELIVFFDFIYPQITSISLYNMTGQNMVEYPSKTIEKDRVTFNYSGFRSGIYILEVIHNNNRFIRKFFFNP